MGKFDKHRATPGSRLTESKMQKNVTPDPESHRRVEPILDASGSLKRHTLSRLDEARIEKPDGAGSKQTGED
tara:strand:- start:11900 stop:12115 length:216 start_codon:yes stop_codon:yes gene_type:complete